MAKTDQSDGAAKVAAPNENTPLLTDAQSSSSSTESGGLTRDGSTAPSSPVSEEQGPAPIEGALSKATIVSVLSTLMLGMFIASADGSIVIAANAQIASEFHRLADASWLVTSYSLAQCACQPLYGKLSDIFGRKSVLVFSYTVFLIGCWLCGIGQEYWHVIAGRTLSGIGGAGMNGLVSVVIADMVPIRDIAKWRSYVNVVATLGRSLGGPVGGWLVMKVGWRWTFLGQCPIAALSAILVIWRLPDLRVRSSNELVDQKEETSRERIARIDFLGAFLLPSALIAFFISLDFLGKSYPWYYIVSTSALAAVLALVFFAVEIYWTKEPIFPLYLIFRRDVFTANALVGLQLSAQFTNFYTVPMYFQIVTRASIAAAGSSLLLMVGGNMVGGIVSGHIISRTQRYKSITIYGALISLTCYTWVFVRWRGSTSWYDTMIVVLGGLGMGMTQSASFIHLAARLQPKEIAIASMSWYLSISMGMLTAINLFNALHRSSLLVFLKQNLEGVKDAEKIIQGAVSDIEYIWTLPAALQKLIVRSYVSSLTVTNALSLFFGVASVITAMTVRQRRLAE